MSPEEAHKQAIAALVPGHCQPMVGVAREVEHGARDYNVH